MQSMSFDPAVAVVGTRIVGSAIHARHIRWIQSVLSLLTSAPTARY
ncbi:hypothetical protein BN973_00193 [Mycobacterium triplex]|uniref:Uncharacterized protein n=1 Tax=Mycobacterium triplex TaxID=47839 RepID=A0A024JPS4_9MYCO|nr:hypothetical protein BN973_00193 [Mycobacterium triplex]